MLDRPLFQLVLARSALAAGHHREAARWLSESQLILRQAAIPEFAGVRCLLQAHLMLEQQKPKEAKRLLRETEWIISTCELWNLLIDHKLLEADLQLRRGQWKPAQDTLRGIDSKVTAYHGRKATWMRLFEASRRLASQGTELQETFQ
jgi:hypothetical protein